MTMSTLKNFALVLVCGVIALSATSQETNLLKNANFAHKNAAGKVKKWSVSPQKGRVVFKGDTATLTFKKGDKLVYLKQENLPMQIGKEYLLTADVKATRGTKFYIYSEAFIKKINKMRGSYFVAEFGNDQTYRLARTLTRPQKSNPARLMILVMSPGTVQVSNLKLKVKPQATNPANFLKPENWRNSNYKDNLVVNQETGQLDFQTATPSKTCGVKQLVQLNQQTAQPITFSAETKATDLKGNNWGYGLYLDIRYTDKTNVWGRKVSFPMGTHDWVKTQRTFVPTKPIKSVTFVVNLRHVTGKTAVRNIQLTQGK